MCCIEGTPGSESSLPRPIRRLHSSSCDRHSNTLIRGGSPQLPALLYAADMAQGDVITIGTGLAPLCVQRSCHSGNVEAFPRSATWRADRFSSDAPGPPARHWSRHKAHLRSGERAHLLSGIDCAVVRGREVEPQ